MTWQAFIRSGVPLLPQRLEKLEDKILSVPVPVWHVFYRSRSHHILAVRSRARCFPTRLTQVAFFFSVYPRLVLSDRLGFIQYHPPVINAIASNAVVTHK
jgi:hypothetical protein